MMVFFLSFDHKVTRVRAIFALVLGLIMVIWPYWKFSIFYLMIGIYLLADGLLNILASLGYYKHKVLWGLRLVEGLVAVVDGLLILLWPDLALITVSWIAGIYLVLTSALLFSWTYFQAIG
jgi:uncharacterized membrane protein HdeD (DUF308 family)